MRSFFETEPRPWTQAQACERSLLAINPQLIYLCVSGIRPNLDNFRPEFLPAFVTYGQSIHLVFVGPCNQPCPYSPVYSGIDLHFPHLSQVHPGIPVNGIVHRHRFQLLNERIIPYHDYCCPDRAASGQSVA